MGQAIRDVDVPDGARPGFSARAATRLASRSGICENFSTAPQFLLQWFNF